MAATLGAPPDQQGNDLPGAEIATAGLPDLKAGRQTIHSLLLTIGAHRLNEAGLTIPVHTEQGNHPEDRLYELLGQQHDLEAHSQYNAWIRRLVSFERAMEQRLKPMTPSAST